MGQQHSCDCRQEDLVGGKKTDEDACRAEEVPRVDGEGDDGADEEAFSDREVFWEERSYIISSSVKSCQRLVHSQRYNTTTYGREFSKMEEKIAE